MPRRVRGLPARYFRGQRVADPRGTLPKHGEGDELHPPGFYTPFRFLDVDFVGKKELLLSDFSDLKGGDVSPGFRLVSVYEKVNDKEY